MEFEPKIHIAIRIGKKLAIRYSVTDTNSKKIHIKKKAFIMQITWTGFKKTSMLKNHKFFEYNDDNSN